MAGYTLVHPKYRLHVLVGVLAWWTAFGYLSEALGTLDVGDALLYSTWSTVLLVLTGFGVSSALVHYNPPQWFSTVLPYLAAASGFGLAWLAELPLETEDSLLILVGGALNGVVLMGITLLSMQQNYLEDLMQQERFKEGLERLNREAEVLKYRQQLQPHFLFNSLNSIGALAGREPEQAREMVHLLAGFFRSTVEMQRKDSISLGEEVRLMQQYLAIEQVRFRHRLLVNITLDDAVGGTRMPPLLLQPLLENAIKYGLYGTTGEVQICLNASPATDGVRVTIENPVDEEQVFKGGTGTGLELVRQRLYLRYLRTDLLSTRKENGKFIAEIKLPALHVEGTDH